jgi:pheromone shutdown-related protein TraB
MTNNYPVININGKEIHLVGTAHVSKVSKDEVKEIINELQPDTVCIELDKQRYESLKDPDKFKNQDITKVIKNHQSGYLLINIILGSFQKRMAKKLDTNSGSEMIQGISSAKEINAEIELVDRNIQTTFSRIWRKHNFFQKTKLIISIIGSIFDDEDITEEDLEHLKQSDMLDAALQEVAKDFPIIKEVLVDERDLYLAHKIKNSKGTKIVVVLGAAHIPGILKNIERDYSIEEYDSIPPKSIGSKVAGWIIPAIIITLIIASFFNANTDGIDQIMTWVLYNGTLSAFGVALALGHPLSILTAFIVAPITSLNPLIAAGWFAGLMEAYIRKPKVKDFESLSVDANSIKGFYKNRVTRILLVVILANIFSTIGTLIGGFEIISNLFG